jgi:hypothetical protein
MVCTVFLQETHDLLSGKQFDTGDSFLVSDGDTDLGGAHSLLGHGDDEIGDGPGGVCDPARGSSLEGSDGGADTFSFSFGLNSAHNL